MPQKRMTDLSEEDHRLLEKVAVAYGLQGRPRDPARLAVWGERVVATFTAGDDRVFLKQWCDFHETTDEVSFCLDIQELARAGGLPTARILRTNSGERVVTLCGRRFTLYEFVGDPYCPTRASSQRLACAEALGHLHSATVTGGIGGKKWPDDPFGLSYSRLDATVQELEDTPLEPGQKSEIRAAVQRLTELLQLGQYRSQALGWRNLPVQPIHGDYCHFNCRFSGDRVAAVVDWDHARLGSRLVDIAHCLNIGLGWSEAIDDYEGFTWADARTPDLEQVGSWLASYFVHGATLSECEARILPWICVCVWPWNVGGHFPTERELYCTSDRVIDFSEKMSSNAKDLTDLALSVGPPRR